MQKSIPMLIYTDTILLGFAEFCSAASTVQTKQHDMNPMNRKKIVALFIQYHYKREVCYERTVQVERPVHSLLPAKSQEKYNAYTNYIKY